MKKDLEKLKSNLFSSSNSIDNQIFQKKFILYTTKPNQNILTQWLVRKN